MNKPWLVAALAACAWACSDSTKPGRLVTVDASVTQDASARDASEHLDASMRLDASTVSCGEATCSADEICVYPACGCRKLSALPDGGCPAKFSPAQNGTCAANCPFYPPYCWRPDGGSLMCSGQDGTISSFIDGPVPAGSSHVCHAICI